MKMRLGHKYEEYNCSGGLLELDPTHPHPYNPKDKQVGGDHYKKYGDYQPWQVLAKWLTPEELKGYMKGTVIAYLAREGDKGGAVDIMKALHTLQLYEECRKNNETPSGR